MPPADFQGIYRAMRGTAGLNRTSQATDHPTHDLQNVLGKLLSPARVLDWMMTDSLKPGASASDSDLGSMACHRQGGVG